MGSAFAGRRPGDADELRRRERQAVRRGDGGRAWFARNQGGGLRDRVHAAVSVRERTAASNRCPQRAYIARRQASAISALTLARAASASRTASARIEKSGARIPMATP